MTEPNKPHSPIAAIDIGSNSVHLAIGSYSPIMGIELVDTEKVTLQLGKALDESNTLSKDAINRTAETLASLKEISTTYTDTIRVVATHASREARNTDELLAAIRNRTGLEVEIIDGIEEARLCFLGIRHGLPLGNQRCLAVDVGGGSTEVMIARGEKLEFISSLKIGAVTLTKAFLSKEKPSDADIARLKDHILVQISPLTSIAKDSIFDRAILSSGTAKTLANVDVYLHHGEELDDFNGHNLRAESIGNILQRLISLREPRKIRTRLSVSQSRSEILLAGTMIIEQITKLFGVQCWTYSSFSLREGLIVDTFQRTRGKTVDPVDSQRIDALRAFADRFEVDKKYAEQVYRLARMAYEQLESTILGRQSDESRSRNLSLLEAACYLHEVGRFVSQNSFHKHSGYLITNSSIPGLTQNEKHLIGYIVQGHRKNGPKPDQLSWSRLYYEHQGQLVFLSACLRIGTSLNRSRRDAVDKIRCVVSGNTISILLNLRNGSGEAEKKKLESEIKQLSRALGHDLNIKEA